MDKSLRRQRLTPGLTRFWRAILDFGAFVRFAVLGVTMVLPLLGAASAGRQPEAWQIFGLLGAGLAYHVFAYVLNDVVDLPIDRSEPRRMNFPLVRGAVTPRQALAVSLAMLPALLALTAWMGGGLWAYLSLAVACLGIAVYDLWGKRSFFPPLTDAVQGLGWAGLIYYGACLLNGVPGPLTMAAGGYLLVFILITNGVHGSLRDLENDLACGVRSTAILFGARPLEAGRLAIPAGLIAYTWAGQALLFLILSLAWLANPLQYPPSARLATALAEITLAGLACVLLASVARAGGRRQEMNAAGMLHLIVVFGMLPVLFAPLLNPALGAVFFGVYLLPFLTHSWLYTGLRWIARAGRAAAFPWGKGDLALGGQVLAATLAAQPRYPLSARVLRTGLLAFAWPRPAGLRPVGQRSAGGCEALLGVTRSQVQEFLRGGWAYTERRLELLAPASDFPLDRTGFARITALQQRLQDLEKAPFDQIAREFYAHPDYAVYQHLGQAFRNQISGRQPFVLQAVDSLGGLPDRWGDVGCGVGLLLGDLLERYPDTRGTGMDISLTLLNHARRVLEAWGWSGRFRLLQADLRALPFPPGSFELLLAMEILEHLPDPAAGVSQLARLLAPGGWLIASVPLNSYTPYHLHVFQSPGEFLALLQNTGMALRRQHVQAIAPGVSNLMVLAQKERG